MNLRYWPNPAHKRDTTEAGPPRWWPAKESCPRMTVDERQALLATSVPGDDREPPRRRFALRRMEHGIEFFEAKLTRVGEDGAEYHGYPTARVPAKTLRQFRDREDINAAEYLRLVKELG